MSKTHLVSSGGAMRRRLLTTSLLAGLSLAAPLGVAALTVLAPTTASAQDYTSGTLTGTVQDAGGMPLAGAAVTVTSNAQGFTRQLTTDANGQFRAPLIPQGTYTVSIAKDGYQTTTDKAIAVRVGGESGYTFNLAEAGGSVDALVVTASANPQLDFSQTTTGISLDVETLQKQVPITRNITSLALLAPGVVEGSSTNFRGQASLAGASVAENAFYLNGLNITNFDNYIGGSTVPFDFYKSVEVKTGGYSAEFGRATGGIINAVSKSGTNDFMVGLHGNYQPGSLMAKQKDSYVRRGKYYGKTDNSLALEAGGPIIKDRLFFYGLVQARKQEERWGSITDGAIYTDRDADPFYGLKLDGYITDKQHLEFTLIDTQRVIKRSAQAYTYDPIADSDTLGSPLPSTRYEQGGVSYVAKYTGSFTDWLTVSAAYGKNKDSDTTQSDLSTEPLVESFIPTGDNGSTARRRVSFQNLLFQDVPRETSREFYRADLDLYFNLLGKHHIRTGFDREELSLTHLSTRNANANYTYREGSATDPRGIPAGQYYIEARTFTGGGSFESLNRAIYIQDSWDVFSNLTLNLGVRQDKFQNRGVSADGKKGAVFVNFDNEIAARLGAIWDATGDGNNKFFANYGRYYLPVASNTAYRQASATLDQSAFFALPTGFQLYLPGTRQLNPAYVNTRTALPLGTMTQITYEKGSICLPGGIGTAGVRGCGIRNNGEVQPAEANTSRNLKSTADDEYIFGYEHRFNSLWRAGATLTYRKSVRAADDVSVDYAVNAYCQENGIAGCDEVFDGFHQYVIINPGKASTIILSDPLPGETQVRTITFTPEQLRYPKVDRHYLGLQLSFERAFDGKWNLQGSYTLSKSQGNYEGYVKTDYAGGQKDSGVTADFDTPALAEGADGLLPNHRAHQIKLFGSYQLTDSLLVGANALVTSGRKYGCIGLHPTDEALNDNYGALSRYCNGVLTPRGSQFSDPWSYRLDLSARYTVPAFGFLPENGLVLRADVFNVFNTRKTIESDEYGETATGTRSTTYGLPTAYQQPRSVRVGFDLTF